MRRRWACAGAGVLSFFIPLASSPASANFVCTMTATDITCSNAGTAPTLFTSTAAGTKQNDTINNSGTANGFVSETTGGGDATATNSGSNTGDISALAINGGSATATNSGSNTGVIDAQATTGNVMATNSGNNTGGIGALTNSGNATAINSGSNAGGIVAATITGNATASSSGSNTGGIIANATVGNATVVNSGSNTAGIAAATNTGNAAVTNSGSNTGGIAVGATGSATIVNSGSNTGLLSASANNATVINSGSTMGGISVGEAGATSATLTNIVGGAVTGPISLFSANNTVNFQGGNWLFTVNTPLGGATTINTGGAPFVVVGSFSGPSGAQVAVLDPTTFALADRSLTNFTGEISEMLQGRFAGMSTGAGGTALGFAGPAGPSGSTVAQEAQAAFSGIPSVAMSYASSGSRPAIGKAAAPAAPYYDTTIWASGFGGERKQRADGDILPTSDAAFGGAMGVDRALGGNLRLGAFVGAGASREAVDSNVQTIDATYVFGGGYGRFDWVSQYLDFSLYGGGLNNKSTRTIANNSVVSGLETATASYGGWFISPEVTYGYRIPFNAVTVTPRLRLRYVGGQLDGYSESGSMQNLNVGRRNINDLEERGEVELSTVSGAFKGSVTVGVIGLERLGNPTINTALLGQNLSFVTPGQASAVGGVVGVGLQYRPLPNVSLYVAGEATAMSDKSDSFAATGGAKVSF